MNKIDLNILNDYYDRGLLNKRRHPKYPLTIWNYSIAVQYGARLDEETQTHEYGIYWDDITKMCRGLVTDDDGNIVARPYAKFFNIEEQRHTPTKEYRVYEKMDGNLGILFQYNGEWIFASRGSFDSEYAKRFEKIFRSKYSLLPLSGCNTYLFEIIAPEFRIVVDYKGLEDVIMLGEINTATGEELNVYFNEPFGYTIVKERKDLENYPKIEHLKHMIKDNEEGFVVKFSNGDRCKIKGERYVYLHSIMTEVSTKSIWRMLKEKLPVDMVLQNVPDEYYNKVKACQNDLQAQYDAKQAEIDEIYNKINELNLTRKEFAEKAKKTKYPGIMFCKLDNCDYSEAVWDMVRPEFKIL